MTEMSLPRTHEVADLTEEFHHMIWGGISALAELQRPSIEKLGYLNDSTEAMSRYGLSLIIEVAEFLNETPWKAWKTKEPDTDRMTEEFVDMLCFIGSWVNLLGVLGISPAHISNAYRRKLIENNARFGLTEPPSNGVQ